HSEEEVMDRKTLVLIACAAAVATAVALQPRVHAQGGAALTGVVSSQAEGKMEGVVVTARRDGANSDVSVVSGVGGTYSFPRTHLTPGDYGVTIRAVGYDLAAPVKATIAAGKTTKQDLSLQKAADMSRQLTSLEWAMNM